MKEVSLLFFKNPNKLIHKLICWWTGSKYYHVEIYFPEDNTVFTTNGDHDLFSMEYMADLPKNIDKCTIIIGENKYLNLKKFLFDEKGTKYDYMGLFLSQFFNKGYQNDEKWFCSEITSESLKLIGLLPKFLPSNKYSPQLVYLALESQSKTGN